jgi:hypothetical protein
LPELSTQAGSSTKAAGIHGEKGGGKRELIR